MSRYSLLILQCATSRWDSSFELSVRLFSHIHHDKRHRLITAMTNLHAFPFDEGRVLDVKSLNGLSPGKGKGVQNGNNKS